VGPLAGARARRGPCPAGCLLALLAACSGAWSFCIEAASIGALSGPHSRLPAALRPGPSASEGLLTLDVALAAVVLFDVACGVGLVVKARRCDRERSPALVLLGFLLILFLNTCSALWLALYWKGAGDAFRLVASFGTLAVLVALPVTLCVLPFNRQSLQLVGASAGMGLALGLALEVILGYFVQGRFAPNANAQAFTYAPYLNATFNLPLLLLAFGLAGYAEVAIAGRSLSEGEREWRARLGAWMLMIGLGWVGFFIATLYLPWAARLLAGQFRFATLCSVVTWLLTTFGGALAGRQARPGPNGGLVQVLLGWLGAVAPYVFLFGLLALVSELVALLPGVGQGLPVDDDFIIQAQHASVWGLLAWLALSLVLLGIMLGVVNVNLFSLHALYANRLARCYLGASRPAESSPSAGAPTCVGGTVRRPNPFTDFDPEDDLPLACLRVSPLRPGSSTYADKHSQPYYGPYPIFNATLNLVGGEDLAQQDRKGESFVLTPDYCGSQTTRYARQADDAGDDVLENLTLGRAVATSGAAADPNMSYHQSTAQTALMTVLNLRLGWWLESPDQVDVGPPGGGWAWRLLCSVCALFSGRGLRAGAWTARGR
jgi:hypothetical protein